MSAPRVPGGNPADPFPTVNEALDILAHQQVYGRDPDTSAALTWGYLGGARWGGFDIVDGTLTLTNSAENYLVVARSTGAMTTSTSMTNWNNLVDYARVFHITTAGGVPTVIRDYRGGPGGVHGQAGGGGGGGSAAPLITDATAARAFDPSDAGSYVRFTATGAKTGTFDVGDGFAAPEEYHVANRGASGNLTLSGSGVTLNPPKGGTLVLEPGDTVTVKFVSSSVADVFGSTEPL
ncbi:hypothetical protein [Hydrogenophaga sp. ANAO-22]|uniref:hypothetical protein n=1 Tax=Hydrogenophaga sp. ANAO-22 TaxID=3166645 RepID=UPI0036D29FFF